MHQSKRLLLSFIIALPALISCNVHADERSFVESVAKSISIIDKEQQALWPGFHISESPSLLHFKNHHVYAFNFTPNGSSAWQKINVDGQTVYYDPDNRYQINEHFSYGYPIEDQIAYVYGYLDVGGDTANLRNLNVFVHERFHIYQKSHFIRETVTPVYNGFSNLENVRLAYLESEALKQYLLDGQIDSLKDYVAVNRYRLQWLDRDSIQYEDEQERSEGAATYVMWMTSIADPIERNKEIIKRYSKEDECSFLNPIDCVLKKRYYFTGAVIGIALDRLSPAEWKLNTERNISIREQLLSHFPMSKNEIDSRLKSAKINYHFDEMAKPIEKGFLDYQAEIQRQLDSYASSPGIKTQVYTGYPCGVVASEYDENVLHISAGISLNLNATMSGQCLDHSFAIKFQVPFKYDKPDYNEIKIAKNASLIIDGRKMIYSDLLSKEQSLSFFNLTIVSPEFEMNVKNHPGTISYENESVMIHFQNNANKAIRINKG